MTADSPRRARLQRGMDGWLEGKEGSNGEKVGRDEREGEKWEKLASLPAALIFCILATMRWKNRMSFFFVEKKSTELGRCHG